jgi:hypothetical protein
VSSRLTGVKPERALPPIRVPPEHARPHSRLFTFEEGSDELRIQCYMHTSECHPQGWYAAGERLVKLRHAFRGP